MVGSTGRWEAGAFPALALETSHGARRPPRVAAESVAIQRDISLPSNAPESGLVRNPALAGRINPHIRQ